MCLCLGAVELEKLPLKKDALRKLKLPFDIKSGLCIPDFDVTHLKSILALSCTLGYIGKLKLQIPVHAIKSQPWVIQIDQLYVVAGPATPSTVSPFGCVFKGT